ncbi:hypothetical protein IF2G_09998 [Cordyceps javanica]|nr:hypothetical protein IF2G_09998 [Cordyceps javanica]
MLHFFFFFFVTRLGWCGADAAELMMMMMRDHEIACIWVRLSTTKGPETKFSVVQVLMIFGMGVDGIHVVEGIAGLRCAVSGLTAVLVVASPGS